MYHLSIDYTIAKKAIDSTIPVSCFYSQILFFIQMNELSERNVKIFCLKRLCTQTEVSYFFCYFADVAMTSYPSQLKK